eukprot:1942712-Pyramimonas_sp.AAC.1
MERFTGERISWRWTRPYSDARAWRRAWPSVHMRATGLYGYGAVGQARRGMPYSMWGAKRVRGVPHWGGGCYVGALGLI